MGLLKTKIKITAAVIIIIAAVAGGLYLGYRLNLVSFPSFGRKPLTIEETANVVDEIKKIGELTTACYYEEIAMHDTRIDTISILGITHHKNNEIVLIGKGTVRAGFDLAKISEEALNAHGDTLEIRLPDVEVFDIILNPSDFSIEYEDGTWDNEMLKPIKAEAKKQLEANAIASGILKKADESGRKHLKNLFATFGYNEIRFNIVKQ
jgi:hypothetical protein